MLCFTIPYHCVSGTGTIDLFYNGFCNNVLWPLIHYIPPPMEVGCSDTYADQWNAYYQANMSFVEAILEVYDDKYAVMVCVK